MAPFGRDPSSIDDDSHAECSGTGANLHGKVFGYGESDPDAEDNDAERCGSGGGFYSESGNGEDDDAVRGVASGVTVRGSIMVAAARGATIGSSACRFVLMPCCAKISVTPDDGPVKKKGFFGLLGDIIKCVANTNQNPRATGI